MQDRSNLAQEMGGENAIKTGRTVFAHDVWVRDSNEGCYWASDEESLPDMGTGDDVDTRLILAGTSLSMWHG